MGNPGRDIFNTKADDVLAPKRQAEIRELLDVLARFRPTKIAVEANSNSPKIKQYQDYLAGKYELGRDERNRGPERSEGPASLRPIPLSPLPFCGSREKPGR
jgi:hypothetical protein